MAVGDDEPRNPVQQASRGQDDGAIRQIDYSSASRFEDSAVAARVNGTPIFVSTVLERHKPMLNQARQQASPEQLEQLMTELIKQDLDGHIEQALVLSAVKSEIKSEQWEKMQTKLDEIYHAEELPRLQKAMNVDSLAEVERAMQASGTTMSAYRRVWGERQIAAQYVAEKLPKEGVSRAELLDAYEESLDEFIEPEQVRWQQCVFTNRERGGEAAVEGLVRQAIDELRSGATFDTVVEKYSDGPRLKQLGNWDWTEPKDLANKELRDALSQLQEGEIGRPIQTRDGMRLVKLTGRRPVRQIPFLEVQETLRARLLQEKHSASAQKLINNLRANAHIETMFETPKTSPANIRAANLAE
ncbi:MAG: peptidyl-prolyl cis-trans isomerase [Planctomycetaceae bacterium]